MIYKLTCEEAKTIVDKFNPILTGTTITKAPFNGYSIVSVMLIQDFSDNFQVNLLIKKKFKEVTKEIFIDLFDYLISTTDYLSLQSQKS